MSNRFWLSLCAFTFGALTMLVVLSLSPATLISFGSFSLAQMLFYGVFLIGPLLYWLYIFFRPRGMNVILRSRPHLSLSALLFGELLILTMVSLQMLDRVNFETASTAGLVLLVLGIVVPLAAWLILFFWRAAPAEPQETSA